MSAGKTSSQSGHAYLGSFLKADPPRQSAYHADGIGTKVCLVCVNAYQLVRIHQQALQAGLPAVLIEDTGNNTCFNGVPTLTAVGIGPVRSSEVPFLKRLSLHP